ncbi:hypothetical protein ACFVUQ_34610 [Streptomyces cyaneofuscatus]|uniref:hypothetical protein n=1 Tax=Streptomyces cyaneofuscatus TaxID=66883 RepID=UPI0036D9473E
MARAPPAESRRVRRLGIVAARVAAHRRVGPVGCCSERVLEVAQAFGRDVEGFHVRAGFPQGPQRRQVQRLAAAGLLLMVVVFRVGRLGREQLLGHRRLLVGDDVVGPAPHDAGRSGAQLLADRRADEDGAVVLEWDAGSLPLPRVLARGPGRRRLAGIGRGAPVRIRRSGRAGRSDRGRRAVQKR